MNAATLTETASRLIALRAAIGSPAPPAIAWRRLQRRFDQRPRRERLMAIAAAVAVGFMVADQLWLGPALEAFNRARAEQQQTQATLANLEAESQRALADDQASAARLRAELGSWRDRVRAGDTALRAYEDTLVGPDRMLPLLEQMLARHGSVRLRGMQSLGRTDLLAPPRAAGAAPAAARDAAPNTTLYRHGVELSLEGGFADLLAYLQALEALPQRLLWGSVQLKVEQYPRTTLTVRLYTISREQHFLAL